MVDKINDLIRYRLAKSKEELQVSDELLALKHYSQSINRSYYSIFHAARAMLAPLQFDSKKHSGIISYFIKYYVKEELIERKYSNIINSARQIRINSDYDDFYIVTKEQAVKQLASAKEFYEMAEKYLNSNK